MNDNDKKAFTEYQKRMSEHLRVVDANHFWMFFMIEIGILKQGEIEKEYKSSPQWTKRTEIIVKQILEERFKIATNKEYFKIDYIGWTSMFLDNKAIKSNCYASKPTKIAHKKDLDNELCLKEYHWDLQVAVEYENKLVSAHTEITTKTMYAL